MQDLFRHLRTHTKMEKNFILNIKKIDSSPLVKQSIFKYLISIIAIITSILKKQLQPFYYSSSSAKLNRPSFLFFHYNTKNFTLSDDCCIHYFYSITLLRKMLWAVQQQSKRQRRMRCFRWTSGTLLSSCFLKCEKRNTELLGTGCLLAPWKILQNEPLVTKMGCDTT
mgnify:CR=1 FL=1